MRRNIELTPVPQAKQVVSLYNIHSVKMFKVDAQNLGLSFIVRKGKHHALLVVTQKPEDNHTFIRLGTLGGVDKHLGSP